jgi:hypothetical protein
MPFHDSGTSLVRLDTFLDYSKVSSTFLACPLVFTLLHIFLSIHGLTYPPRCVTARGPSLSVSVMLFVFSRHQNHEINKPLFFLKYPVSAMLL